MDNKIYMDVSEIKAFKQCRRLWQFTSRNRWHTTPRVPSDALALGTLFHEALAQLYSGADFEDVMKLVHAEAGDAWPTLKAMLTGYLDILCKDLEDWKVLATEHVFQFPTGITRTVCGESVCIEQEVIVTGVIDLIVYEKSTNTVWCIEHKTCKSFRDDIFSVMDEQPRVYFEAVERYIETAKNLALIPQDASNGGVVINEVKKLIRGFQYKRSAFVYRGEDRSNFLREFFGNLADCQCSVAVNEAEMPSPSYMGCRMCAYKDVCGVYGYTPVTKKELLEGFGLEFKEREVDHIHEKRLLGGVQK